jgi:N-acetylmuramidase/Putative peptidoglycan binding domain
MRSTSQWIFEAPVADETGPSGGRYERAVERNRHFARALGWQPYYDQIARLLGFSALTPAEAAFAAAVQRWQRAQGLAADGILGPNTWARMRARLGAPPARPSASPVAGAYFKDDPVLARATLAPSTPIAIDRQWPATLQALAATYNRLGGLIGALASRTSIEVAAVLAIWQIESGGRQHTPGRAIIRFENHLLYRNWGQSNQALYDQHFRHGGRAGQPGRSWQGHEFCESAGAGFQPVHSGQQATEYRALELASRLAGQDAALKSISIGGPQILISNHQLIGYSSPRAMYDAFQADERAHVLGFFDFCRHTRAPSSGDLLRYLRERRWPDFARYYNGPGQVATYGGRIQNAYDQARRLPIAGI